ncbi:MAG: N-acetylmuramoyl-L-alanine amidase [Crocinitomicaceae bacterium]|jgi:N-acetyl-anhydromuramyl-L-alanine amidase AmpD
MKPLGFILSLLLCSNFGFSQSAFEQAYKNNSLVPSGILEAVAYTNTHMVHLTNYASSCIGLPQAYGIMGLHDDGKNYFNENGALVATISGISIKEQRNSAAAQIEAYAKSFNYFMQLEVGKKGNFHNPKAIRNVLHQLSEIPDSGLVNNLARDMQVYSILDFMNDLSMAQTYDFDVSFFDLESVFGSNNYAVLSSPRITLTSTGAESSTHEKYQISQQKSAEFGPAIWNPAQSCNFSSRSGVAISAITIHTIQGTYAGAISWAQNCSSSVSYHYVIRSSDGQVTQMVLEADKAWHVGSENPYTIGYEHEGYVNDPSWYTEEMYTSSSDLSRDITNSGYGIPPLRTFYGDATIGTNLLGGCTKIKGHQHYPNQTHTDPGINWDWEKYYRMINNSPVITTLTNPTDNFYDTGGATGDYANDERELWLIEPSNAQSITIDFTVFNVESGYDNLYIYDGNTIDAPLIGSYTGSNSPGTITSSSGALLIEFRSDCSTLSNGWEASYTTSLYDVTAPATNISSNPIWHTTDFTIDIIDSDTQSGPHTGFYLLGEKLTTSTQWNSNGSFGFVHEPFDENATNWTSVVGTYTNNNGAFIFSDTNEQNSNSYTAVTQDLSSIYLYSWDQVITSSASNQRAGMHFFCDNPNLPHRGNSYFVYLRENDDKIQLFSVTNDVINLETEIDYSINSGQTYNCKTIYNPNTGEIKVYVDDVYQLSWTDVSPLVTGGFISLRTGGTSAEFDNVHVYKSRLQSVNASTGTSSEFSIESENAIPTGICKSIVIDSAENWSQIDEEYYLLDFTPPVASFLNDGLASDIDTFTTTTIEANWQTTDIHSGIGNYEFAIGTLPNVDDVVSWTGNGLTESVGTVISSPVYNQVYYISIRAYNQAGLYNQFMSNGQRYIDNLGLEESILNNITMYPNPTNSLIRIDQLPNNAEVLIYNIEGKLIHQQNVSGDFNYNAENLASGTYKVVIQHNDSFVVKQLIVQH